ncbi:MAG: hypothetical protein RBT41_10690 [Clostridia bacterium]|nr:hypothetical protein [Clostridia bacterium]
MQKIKDRDTLSIISGMIGLAGLILIDEISQKVMISKRSYRQAAAGVFVSKKEAKSTSGQLLGVIMNSAVSILGANYIIKRMSQNGRDKLIFKGIISGIIFGAIATVIPNVTPRNKMKPKDAASNLSYVFSNIVFGLLTTFSAAKLGHDSLFDAPPQNDYLQPTEQTSEQLKSESGFDYFHSDQIP